VFTSGTENCCCGELNFQRNKANGRGEKRLRREGRVAKYQRVKLKNVTVGPMGTINTPKQLNPGDEGYRRKKSEEKHKGRMKKHGWQTGWQNWALPKRELYLKSSLITREGDRGGGGK